MTQKEKKAAYYQANKEKIYAQKKARREANREQYLLGKKSYYQANRERAKKHYLSNIDSVYTVYYLLEEHYVGMTKSLKYRLKEHKYKYNRHIQDVEIIGKYQTKKGATRVEAALHAMGYLGRDYRHKQQTLKQLI
tara:strand:+ start:267 stop:674 length:408 start_codon:yes stop_codon:yes gene_type:complete